MIALVFVICIAIFAICFWHAFGELERPPNAISSKSSRSRVGLDKAVAQQDGPAS